MGSLFEKKGILFLDVFYKEISMKKIIIPVLLALASSQSFAASMNSQGSATTSLTVRANTGWSITKGEEGMLTLVDGKVHDLDNVPTMIIRNDSLTAANYELRGQGASKGDDGTVFFVKRGDNTKKFATANFAAHSDTVWSEEDALYKSKEPLQSGAEKTIELIPYQETTVEPGVYDVSVELLTETL